MMTDFLSASPRSTQYAWIALLVFLVSAGAVVTTSVNALTKATMILFLAIGLGASFAVNAYNDACITQGTTAMPSCNTWGNVLLAFVAVNSLIWVASSVGLGMAVPAKARPAPRGRSPAPRRL